VVLKRHRSLAAALGPDPRPTQRLPTCAFYSTNLAQDPLSIVTGFIKRWSIEVT
jgi:hypothetical protein